MAQGSHDGAQGMMHGDGQGHMMQGMHGASPQGDHAGAGARHDSHGAETAVETGSPASDAYRAANLAMHEAMDIEFTGNADVDFARGMIGHHRGAIDMARIVLQHGEDPGLRQLAEEVIEAQEAEIEFLENWLAENAE
ncbi:CopM family metallochaperone [Citreimonas salinaria]|nr:DUF305 domain-containing protein [Citreimonas salinaria]